jgi:hypothetical protein
LAAEPDELKINQGQKLPGTAKVALGFLIGGQAKIERSGVWAIKNPAGEPAGL